MSKISDPKVSISIITYNQADYIAKAIDSILAQRRNFEIEIIIGDDFSDDGTQAIIKEYQKAHPHIIQLILHPLRNPGIPGRVNNTTNLYCCRGKYIAMLDGDDYWIDEDKLQRQVDFLDREDQYAGVAHSAKRISTSGEDQGYYWRHGDKNYGKTDYSHSDILATGWCFAQTSTLMFRNNLFVEFPEWFWEVLSADYALLLIIGQYGTLKYWDEPMSVYTVHEKSFMAKHFYSKASIKIKINELRIFKDVFLNSGSRNLGKTENDARSRALKRMNRTIARYKFNLFKLYRRENNAATGLAYLAKASFSDSSIYHFLAGGAKSLKK